MTMPGVPVYGGEFPGRFRFWLMPRQKNEPPRVEGTATIVGDEWNILLDAIVGDKGEKGEPAEIIRRDFSLNDPGDLPDTATLDESDYGRAWYIQGNWHIFDDGQWFVRSGSLEGPPGPTPDITISAEGIEAPDPVTYGPIDVEESGTSIDKTYHFKIPLVPGPEGPAAAISDSWDFEYDPETIEVGQVIGVTDVDPPKYGPVDAIQRPVLKHTIPHNSFIDHTGSQDRFLIASLNLPAYDFDWYPDVTGHLLIARQNIFASISTEVEVRIGPTGVGTGETEDLCALGPYDPSWALVDSANIVNILPHFSDTLNPSRAVDPDSAVGRVPAGQAMTVYVFIHKTGGAGNYVFSKNGAQLRVNVEPA